MLCFPARSLCFCLFVLRSSVFVSLFCSDCSSAAVIVLVFAGSPFCSDCSSSFCFPAIYFSFSFWFSVSVLVLVFVCFVALRQLLFCVFISVFLLWVSSLLLLSFGVLLVQGLGWLPYPLIPSPFSWFGGCCVLCFSNSFQNLLRFAGSKFTQLL
jgi:hypothetical protein